MNLPNQGQTVQPTAIPAQTDWLALSKTVVIELAFIASVAALLFVPLSSLQTTEAEQLAIATGATLGVLRLGDVIANVLNVRAFLAAPAARSSGVVPQAVNTPLIVTSTPENKQADHGSNT